MEIVLSRCSSKEYKKFLQQCCTGRSKFVYEWLKQNKFDSGARFYSNIGNVKKYIDFFSNRIKHANQGFDYFTAKKDEVIIPGFYIQEVKGMNYREICPKLPKRYERKVIAFSFNRTLKVLMLFFYKISDSLESVIKEHIKDFHNIKIKPRILEQEADLFFNIVENICSLDEYYYPYEYEIKQVRFRSEGKYLHISCPHGDRCPYRPPLELSATFKGDGYTRAFPIVDC